MRAGTPVGLGGPEAPDLGRHRIAAATASATTVAGLALIVGAAFIVGGLFFVRYPQFRVHVLATGLVGFYLPGALVGCAALGLRRRWAWAVPVGLGGAALQALLGSVATVGQFFLPPVTPIPIFVSFVWTLAAALLAWQLWRAWPWVRVEVRSGFEPVLRPKHASHLGSDG